MKHSFFKSHAEQYGISAAVILDNMMHWISHNKSKGQNLKEGRTWTYNSYSGYAQLFGYMSKDQVRRAIEKLISEGVIIKGDFNAAKFDRTSWYALADESILYELNILHGNSASSMRHPDARMRHSDASMRHSDVTIPTINTTINTTIDEGEAAPSKKMEETLERDTVLLSYDKMRHELLSKEQANQVFAMQLSGKKKCSAKDIDDLISAFIMHLKASDITKKSSKDLRSHWMNWSRMQWRLDEWPLKVQIDDENRYDADTWRKQGFDNVIDHKALSDKLKQDKK